MQANHTMSKPGRRENHLFFRSLGHHEDCCLNPQSATDQTLETGRAASDGYIRGAGERSGALRFSAAPGCPLLALAQTQELQGRLGAGADVELAVDVA
jgi:hypothetical protein